MLHAVDAARDSAAAGPLNCTKGTPLLAGTHAHAHFSPEFRVQ